ncbi:MAG TPA: hypothetical protein VFJ16_09225, partial [Longimicrobium sp.]|nr:hypothetical protein [Longimicrobium sp.]
MDQENRLGFTYTPDRSIEVLARTREYLADTRFADLDSLTWAYHSVGDLIPHTNESFWSGHYFPWKESWEELQISYTLCTFGLYKQAMISLRSAFETGLLSVYWNLDDDGHEVIQEWLRSRENTPRFDKIWRKLQNHPNFESFQQKYDIRKRLLDLGYLHDYVHAKGVKFS